jgi:hypothetical protein
MSEITVESGEITEVEVEDEGRSIIWFGDPDFAEQGIAVYNADLSVTPTAGDEIVVEGFDNPYGATKLEINGVVQYDRSDKEAQILYAIRRLEANLTRLQQELEDERR